MVDDSKALEDGPPLFDGEPEHCAFCGEAGHTHDDHWIFAEVEHLGLRTCTPAERDLLDTLNSVPEEALETPAEAVWEPLRLALRAARG